ncbi:Os01g0304500, partial [Oryza sativa Japonica Group]
LRSRASLVRSGSSRFLLVSASFMVQAISSSTISIISARQKLICSHSSAPSLKVGCSSDSPFLLFPTRRNHTVFVIRVELGPPAQFRLTGLMLELLRFNDEPRGDPSLSPVTHTPKSIAQQQTSVLCRFRGGSRWGLTVCQTECTSFEAQDSSRRGFAADPCRLATFSVVRLFQEDCFRSSVNPPFSEVALLLSVFILGYVMGFIL